MSYFELVQKRLDLIDEARVVAEEQSKDEERLREFQEIFQKESTKRQARLNKIREDEGKVAEVIKHHPDNPKNKKE